MAQKRRGSEIEILGSAGDAASRERAKLAEDLQKKQSFPGLLMPQGTGTVRDALRNPLVIGGLGVMGLALLPTSPIAGMLALGTAAWALKNR